MFIVGADGKIIVHKDRQMLYKPITDTYFSIEDFDQSEGIERITFHHHNYFALYHRASNNNWMYISLIPYDELMNRLYEHVKAASVLFVYEIGYRRLLWNNLHTYELMQESMDIAGVNFEFPYFMTAIAAISEFPYIDDHVQRRGIIRDLIERRFNEEFSAAGILLDEDKLAFIFNIPEHMTENERNKKIKDTCSE